jgi:hypothetical protein
MLIGGLSLLSCSSEDPMLTPEPKVPSGDLTVAEIDSLSNHMRFVGSRIAQGNSPSVSSGSALKINVRDTLYLVPGIPVAVKFLHDDITNIAGAYVQLHSYNASTNTVVYGTYHFDVPELAETDENDTISIVMIGFDPQDFELPVPLNITVTPYDESGQPLDKTEVPVVVEDPTGSGVCGLVQPETYWEWEHSYILNHDYIHTWINFYPAYPDLSDSTSVYAYYYAPEKLWGGNQMVKGCCFNGISSYSSNCLNTPNERTLPFPTYYQQDYESIEFRDNGTYRRITRENSANPLPDESDFCGGIVGLVDIDSNNGVTEGSWTITPDVAITIKHIYKEEVRTVDYLQLKGTSSSGGGWGNPGGAVIRLSCNQLMLLQPGGEGGNSDLWKIYKRVEGDGIRWFEFR